jgi:hypothetical protein
MARGDARFADRTNRRSLTQSFSRPESGVDFRIGVGIADIYVVRENRDAGIVELPLDFAVIV